MRLFLAFRVFFAVLFRRNVADQVRVALTDQAIVPKIETQAEKVQPSKPANLPAKNKPSPRNEALTLLSALQRDARFLDLVCESLDQYNDSQIGAAARDVLRDSRKTLDRMFGLKHLSTSEEGATIEIPNPASPIRWRIIGKESQSGTISHPGWQATKIDMPQWTGNADDALVISATEVET